jgi:hypothetical protein
MPWHLGVVLRHPCATVAPPRGGPLADGATTGIGAALYIARVEPSSAPRRALAPQLCHQ